MATAAEQGELSGRSAATGEMLEEALRILGSGDLGEYRLWDYATAAGDGSADALQTTDHKRAILYADAWAEAFVAEVLRVRDERAKAPQCECGLPAGHEDTRQ